MGSVITTLYYSISSFISYVIIFFVKIISTFDFSGFQKISFFVLFQYYFYQLRDNKQPYKLNELIFHPFYLLQDIIQESYKITIFIQKIQLFEILSSVNHKFINQKLIKINRSKQQNRQQITINNIQQNTSIKQNIPPLPQQNVSKYNPILTKDGVNYYKGVLLCSRPNQSPSIQKQKVFCGRVTPSQQLGLLPCKRFNEHKNKKRNLPVLNNHKKWLESFKQKLIFDKVQEEQLKKRQFQKLQKIKDQGLKKRQQLKKYNILQGSGNKQNKLIKSIINKNQQQKLNQQICQSDDDKQVDQLIHFFDNQHMKNYIDNEQINHMLKDLKSRIEQIKKQGQNNLNWKEKHLQKQQSKKQQKPNIQPQTSKQQKDKKDDILTKISKNPQSKSIASQKTVERVQELEKKKKEKQWDKNTTSQKKSYNANLDLQIAKNIADQVLRNYPHLKHHSNQSIRKLLEKQAHEQIKS